MEKRQGKLFAVWGDTPQMRTRKMYKLGSFRHVDGSEIPYGYVENEKGIQFVGELYSLIERDSRWKMA
jgi:hypothetical protein